MMLSLARRSLFLFSSRKEGLFWGERRRVDLWVERRESQEDPAD